MLQLLYQFLMTQLC